MAIARTGSNLPNGYFIPQLYPKKFLAKFYAASVCNKVCNFDYEGEIKAFGNTVNIRKIPDVVVNPTLENEKINWQDLQDSQIQLTINYAYDAAVKIGNIDFHQMDVDLQGAIVNEMANRLRISIENVILGGAYASATTARSTLNWSTAGQSTLAFSLAQGDLSSLNIPSEERYFVAHPLAVTYLVQEVALYALNAGNAKGALIAGYVGEYAGFSVYQSTLVPGAGTSGSPYISIAGQKVGITLATQFTQFEVDVPLQDYYGKGIRCQNCFGYKVAYPDGLDKVSVQTH